MNRRNFVRLGVASALPQAATEISEARQKPRPKQSRPNILMIMADQLRADCLGAYGNGVIKTPHIDRIGAEGVTFTNAYTCVPSCTPARSALLTGLAPWHHGMLGMVPDATRYPVEKPRALADAGYYTAVAGKNHFYPIRNSHGYHQMVLDEHCSYWFDKQERGKLGQLLRKNAVTTKPGSGRKAAHSQSPRDGSRLERLSRQAVCFSGTFNATHWTGRLP